MTLSVAPVKHPNKFHTKIVGTTFEGRQEKLARVQELGIEVLHLRHDYANPYDPNAIAVEAVLRDAAGNITEVVQLGFISNSDRQCMVCGKLLDGSEFSRSKVVKCPHCAKLFQYVKAGDVSCPGCSKSFRTDMAKTVSCPTCMGDEWVRDGLATCLARALNAGIEYAVRVKEYTGGDTDEKGKSRTRGCNIFVEQLEKDLPV